nr:hypothetical protein [Streptomyces sp. TSRI0281]
MTKHRGFYSPHLTTRKCRRVADWAEANNVEIACTPTNSSWLNRIEAQFTALRYFTLDGTDHSTHKAQGSMIRRYIIWRNHHANDNRLRALVEQMNRPRQRRCAVGSGTTSFRSWGTFRFETSTPRPYAPSRRNYCPRSRTPPPR